MTAIGSGMSIFAIVIAGLPRNPWIPERVRDGNARTGRVRYDNAQ